MAEVVTVYTDGACKHNPGPGGWAWVRIETGREIASSVGGEAQTTNNRMEMMAVIRALEHFAAPVELHVVTDSKYVSDGLAKWLPGWKKRNWRLSTGDPVKNQDLWQRLDGLAAGRTMRMTWTRGHDGDAGNELADNYAQRQAALFNGDA